MWVIAVRLAHSLESRGLLWDPEQRLKKGRGIRPKWVNLTPTTCSVELELFLWSWRFLPVSSFWKNHEDLGSVFSIGTSHPISSYLISSPQGIFPKSFIYIKEVTVEKKRYLPSFPRLDSEVARGFLHPVCFENLTWQMWRLCLLRAYVCLQCKLIHVRIWFWGGISTFGESNFSLAAAFELN